MARRDVLSNVYRGNDFLIDSHMEVEEWTSHPDSWSRHTSVKNRCLEKGRKVSEVTLWLKLFYLPKVKLKNTWSSGSWFGRPLVT